MIITAHHKKSRLCDVIYVIISSPSNTTTCPLRLRGLHPPAVAEV